MFVQKHRVGRQTFRDVLRVSVSVPWYHTSDAEGRSGLLLQAVGVLAYGWHVFCEYHRAITVVAPRACTVIALRGHVI